MSRPLFSQIKFPIQPALLGTGFAILVAISATMLVLNERLTTATGMVLHTVNVQAELSNLLLRLRRMESGQRGYLLTQDPEYLRDYLSTLPDIDPELTELKSLMSDNPARIAALNEITGLVGQKIGEIKKTVELNEAGDRDASLALVKSGGGLALMTTIMAKVEHIIADEDQLLKLRSEASQRTQSRLLYLLMLGTGLITLIGAASVFFMQRTTREIERARNELEVTNTNLEEIVAHRTADLVDANDEIQRFAYIVSHDLRSPLVNIMGFTAEIEELKKDLIERAEKTAVVSDGALAQGPPVEPEPVDTVAKDFDEAIGFIKASITKMDRLINAVLKLSREGQRTFKPEQIDMSDLIGAIMQTVAHRVTEFEATVNVSKLPPVISDRLAVEQVFSNLIDNALKYRRPDVSPRIDITGRRLPRHVIYEVRDNGRGIDQRDFQRVFDLFRRAGPQDQPGEGIGLAHVRTLVRRLGGTMKLASEVGKGSVFTVTLPREWTGEKRSER